MDEKSSHSRKRLDTSREKLFEGELQLQTIATKTHRHKKPIYSGCHRAPVDNQFYSSNLLLFLSSQHKMDSLFSPSSLSHCLSAQLTYPKWIVNKRQRSPVQMTDERKDFAATVWLRRCVPPTIVSL